MEDFKAIRPGQACSFRGNRKRLVYVATDKRRVLFQEIPFYRVGKSAFPTVNFVCSHRSAPSLKPKMDFDLQIVARHFPELTDSQIKQFRQFAELIAEWNQKLNLISRADIENLPLRHILHSLAIAKTLNFEPGTQILDVGTGGGFPGVPLAILCPDCQFLLIDSVGKKIKAVSNCIESLKLENATAQQTRAENVKSSFDYVIARAVTQLPKFLSWIRNRIKADGFNALPNGVLCLKGGDLSHEFADLSEKPELYPIRSYFGYPEFEDKFVVHVPIESK
tara:strand:+ start:320 stop:1156 length:837 start_codon:yes stop_codon:yes gene_type:complete